MTVKVQREVFDAGAEAAALTAGRDDIGAVVTFVGLVRGEAGGRPLEFLTLEHYPGMTEAELRRIESEACARFSLAGSLIIHRIGKLEPGDPIVLVIAAAAHRQAAFDGAQYLMDYLKTDAPFWKKESFRDGSEGWVDARETDDEARSRWVATLTKSQP